MAAAVKGGVEVEVDIAGGHGTNCYRCSTIDERNDDVPQLQ